ncbi:MAG TPA: dTDP-4-dehydrorhamnose reductase, partial [Candidatus Binatia bacterium]|nr:dTDP-4-dehydrorhamnose reductase [Candidatus Binatia bacterium]
SEENRFEVIALRHEDADCADAEGVRKALKASRPQVVINAAAYVRVDDAEDHAEEAFRVNALGALNVARACAEINALCVYVSTDYVFDGAKDAPYVESDTPNPINVYGASKLAGEILVRQAAPRWLIVRVASLFGKTGARGKGGNFIETILGKAKSGEPLKIVSDVQISPTYTRDAARAMLNLIEHGRAGMVHLANTGACTWYGFAEEALRLAHLQGPIEPVSSNDYPYRARRPRNSALASEYMPRPLRPWQDALAAYLAEKGHITSST